MMSGGFYGNDHTRRWEPEPRRGSGAQAMDATAEAEEWWVQEVITHRGKTTRNQDCTPGYYNFEGESNRRQDGNYNGGFRQYITHMSEVRAKMAEHFVFTLVEDYREGGTNNGQSNFHTSGG